MHLILKASMFMVHCLINRGVKSGRSVGFRVRVGQVGSVCDDVIFGSVGFQVRVGRVSGQSTSGFSGFDLGFSGFRVRVFRFWVTRVRVIIILIFFLKSLILFKF